MKIAVKGFIGTGKSYVSKLLVEKKGFEVFNCDEYVHYLYDHDEDLKAQLLSEFGTDKRSEMRDIVFNDQAKLAKLEAIILPKVEQKMLSLESENIIWDCQTIDKLDDVEIDLTLICTADKDTIIKRVQARDGRSVEDINKILLLQDKIHLYQNRTYFIDTTNDDEQIIKQIDKMIRSYNASKDWEDCE